MKRLTFVLATALLTLMPLSAREHPVLLLTRDCVADMKADAGKVPMFDSSVSALLFEADAALARPIDVPVPHDGGGGPTHETHKQNYYDMYSLGVAWQLTSDVKYAGKLKSILEEYAKLYPKLGPHPVTMSPVRGQLFWQTLNESVWLVHTSMAYDCVRDYLTPKERKNIEDNLLRKVASFIMEGTPANVETFNKMHNHGTWATAAVGMAGMAMDDDNLVDKALWGSDKTGKNGGFVKQLDYLFSPDGYFTEGAYYQRYALWPFVTFAQCISHVRPDLGIFKYRDGILLKAVDTLLQLAYNGEFFHYNDALEKGYTAQELIYAVDIAYNANQSNKQLLSICRDYQGRVLVSDAGYAVARDLSSGQAEPFMQRSALFHDGKDGSNGVFAVIRNPRPELNSALTMKATSHGLSHGHYDKLTIAYYDNGNEVLSDYGAARFLNIEVKHNGNYTPLNKAYAMTTLAHNTLVVDEKSHFNANYKESSKHSPSLASSKLDGGVLQYVSAVDSCAVPGVRMQRWVALADVPFLEYPLLIDVFKADSKQVHAYDLPYHYNGHMISMTVPYSRSLETMSVLGHKNGYQHMWVEAKAQGAHGSTTYTFLNGNRMYSLSAATTGSTEIVLARTGANDPYFYLRSEPAIIFRLKGQSNHVFANCLETHGKYDLVTEQSGNLVHSCIGIDVNEDADNVYVRYSFAGGHECNVTISLKSNELTINNK